MFFPDYSIYASSAVSIVRMSVRTSFVVNDVRAFFVLGVASGFPLVFVDFLSFQRGGNSRKFFKNGPVWPFVFAVLVRNPVRGCCRCGQFGWGDAYGAASRQEQACPDVPGPGIMTAVILQEKCGQYEPGRRCRCPKISSSRSRLGRKCRCPKISAQGTCDAEFPQRLLAADL